MLSSPIVIETYPNNHNYAYSARNLCLSAVPESESGPVPKDLRGPAWKVALTVLCHFLAGTTLSLAAQKTIRIAVPVNQTEQEMAITQMFAEETARRASGGLRPSVESGAVAIHAGSGNLVVLAERSHIAALLPARLVPMFNKSIATLHPNDHPQGFSIVSIPWHQSTITVIAGNDAHGELFGQVGCCAI